MHRLLVALLLAACALGAVACTDVRDRLGEVRESADEIADQARFCFALARALTALDGGSSPEAAADAAEEVLAQAPDHLRDDARIVAEGLRAARDGDPDALRDPEFQAAAQRLRDDTRELCDPTT